MNRLSLALILGIMLSTIPFTLSNQVEALETTLFDEPVTSNTELAEIRGGYLSAGGLLIEFGLTTKTLIDGVTQREISFGTAPGQQEISPAQLREVIQVGQNNQAIPQEVLDNLPGIVTIIQNSESGKLIQNINTLDLTVSNAGSFLGRGIGSTVTGSSVGALR